MSRFLSNLVRFFFNYFQMQKFMLNCCKQDNTANSRSNFDVDENNIKADKNNVNGNTNKEEVKEEEAKVENQNNTENKPAQSSGGFKRTKTKHYK